MNFVLDYITMTGSELKSFNGCMTHPNVGDFVLLDSIGYRVNRLVYEYRKRREVYSNKLVIELHVVATLEQV